jgi:hypothetical protein
MAITGGLSMWSVNRIYSIVSRQSRRELVMMYPLGSEVGIEAFKQPSGLMAGA